MIFDLLCLTDFVRVDVQPFPVNYTGDPHDYGDRVILACRARRSLNNIEEIS